MQTRLQTYTVVLVLCAGLGATGGPLASALAATGGTSVAAATTTPSGAGAGPATSVAPSAIATWFGPGLYGKHTACGQRLTPKVVGVANRTLPCGTLVQVTYAGHSLVVPVLDRGPYSHDASWDLTAAAAQALDVTQTVRVATQIVGKTANTPMLGLPAAPSSSLAPASGASASGGALAG
ncbi:MAG TPA: septal ring lytic transglycosylase RlpA family protein [Solirubrobacteraceae bacterium]|nr:septal ring lytic transglycosylase RlpA family protein [Solirubrobacteraceae bacterium]